MQSDYETFTDLMYNLKYQQTNMGTFYLSKMMLVYRNEKGRITKVYTGQFAFDMIGEEPVNVEK